MRERIKLFMLCGQEMKTFEVYFFDNLEQRAHFIRGFEAAAESLAHDDYLLTRDFSEIVDSTKENKSFSFLRSNDNVFRHYCFINNEK